MIANGQTMINADWYSGTFILNDWGDREEGNQYNQSDLQVIRLKQIQTNPCGDTRP